MARDCALATVTASDAAALVAGKRPSQLDLTEAALAAIAAREPDISAFAALDPERATHDARRLTAAAADH